MATTRKIALITGANKGIGLETARQLMPLGVHVLIGARDIEKGKRAATELRSLGDHVGAIAIDVTNEASIAAAATSIERDFGKLDILINNAGMIMYGADGPASSVNRDALRATFDTNFFGLITVTQAMLHLVRKSEAGRIVNLSSILGSIAEHADPSSSIYQMKVTAYDTSKAAVNMYTNHLAHELRGTPIKVNAAHPGWVKTDMGGAEAPMEIVDGAKTSVMLATLGPDGPSGGFFHMGVHMRW